MVDHVGKTGRAIAVDDVAVELLDVEVRVVAGETGVALAFVLPQPVIPAATAHSSTVHLRLRETPLRDLLTCAPRGTEGPTMPGAAAASRIPFLAKDIAYALAGRHASLDSALDNERILTHLPF